MTHRSIAPFAVALALATTVLQTTPAAQSTNGAAAAGAYYGSGCVQVVDAYGRVVTRC